jgi:uncharacterized small protein (DUF1192 family)
MLAGTTLMPSLSSGFLRGPYLPDGEGRDKREETSPRRSRDTRQIGKERDMDWDDERPKPVKGVAAGDNLETLGVAELEARIKAFESEIERVREELAKKRAHEAAAAKLFKS